MNAATLAWGRAWAFARADLKGGARGLRLLFLCLFLGTAALAGIGSLTAALTGELSARGQVLLGGDVEAELGQRPPTDAELATIRQAGGRLSDTLRLNAMIQRTPDASSPPSRPAGTADTLLIEVKAVDDAYPLYGEWTLADGRRATLPDADGILVGQDLADRMAIRPRDRVRLGTADFTVVGLIGNEPDRVGEGFTLGPVAMVSLAGMERTGLVQPGSLYARKIRIRLPEGADAAAAAETLNEWLAGDGWEIRDRDRAAPGADRFLGRLGQFLGLIGLAALVIAGIGVGGGVTSYLTARRPGIATFKTLGARSGDIARIYGLEIGAVAIAGILAGLVVGALVPMVVVALAGDALPVRPGFAVHPEPLMIAALQGLGIAALFTIAPLMAARDTRAAELFRTTGLDAADAPGRGRGGWRGRLLGTGRVRLWQGLAALLVAAMAIGTARDPLFAAGVLASVAGVLGLLGLIGLGVTRIVARLPAPASPVARLALANLHRPGSRTPALVVALGLSLTLFVTLAAIQTSLSAELARTVPAKAPDQFVLDVPRATEADVRRAVERVAPGTTVTTVPALRATITAYGPADAMTEVASLDEIPRGAWFLRGERGLTYAATLPEGSTLVDGAWWPADYRGPPLISLDADAAEVLGLRVGDALRVNLLGRDITATIASTRAVAWETFGFNYVMVMDPATLAAAPHSLAATIKLPDTADGAGLPARQTIIEGAVARAILALAPGASVVAVGDVLAQVGKLLGQMAGAIAAAASVAVLAGIAVLAGAIAAARAARTYDSVILKTLGATRRQILGMQAIELGVLSLVLGLVALAIGGGAAWFVIVRLFEFRWAPDWGIVAATLAGGALATLAIGLIASLPVLAARPARALRTL